MKPIKKALIALIKKKDGYRKKEIVLSKRKSVTCCLRNYAHPISKMIFFLREKKSIELVTIPILVNLFCIGQSPVLTLH